ncbi:sulfatase-like hydrolase/transferase [Aquicoccus sp. SCR17]|nr:sulfatase-like hydrolase/transferase [Carideicomes alvinocaridis]
MPPKKNVLFITLDQMPASILWGPLADHVPTPNIDRLAANGLSFRNHFTVTVPCGPARASLITGLYAMNHRSIRNGTPLARHHATMATEARKSGYEPLLFGYTDTTPDPTDRAAEDPDLSIYEGVAPGFRELVEMRMEAGLEWPAYLKAQGYDFDCSVFEHQLPVAPKGRKPRPSDPAPYAAEHSDTAYLTDRTLQALEVRRKKPWFAHVAYIRPHPPLIAPAPYNTLVDPTALPLADRSAPDHPFMDAWFSAPSQTGLSLGHDGKGRDVSPELEAELRGVYLGLVAEVDHHLGRLLDWLEETGQAERTLVVLTVDHGEMLGEKCMWGKESVFDPAYHVPLILSVPGASPREVEALTESVDVAPTILDWIGRAAPRAMDGQSLLPFAEGTPEGWRDAVMAEADFGHPERPTRIQKHLGLAENEAGVAILREARWKYIHFAGELPPMLFDLEADPGETRDLGCDPAHREQVARLAGKLLDRMMARRDRRLTHHAIGA